MPRRLRAQSLTPWTVLVRTSLVCGLLATILFGLSLRRIEPLPISLAPPRFQAARAFDSMSRLAKGFPNRAAYAENRRKAAQWIRGEFSKMDYEPRGLQFSEVIAGEQYSDLEDIYVEKTGTKHPDEIVLAVAHYDVTDTTVEGAMDDASGVGVVLELARIFAETKTDRTLIFLTTDSEEFGAYWGARAFARNFDRANQIVAVANFDFVTAEHQTRILTLCDGLKSGFTPLWLRELALGSLRSLGTVGVDDPTNVLEFIQRSLLIPAADHGAFLAEGIPAFNWVGQTDNFAHIMAYYHHTPADRVEAMEPASFAPFGQGAERLLRSIDALPRIPENFRNSSYWKISPTLYIDGWAVTLLHILAFIPFLAYGFTRFGRAVARRTRRTVFAVIGNEAKNMAILFGSLLLGYVVMLALPALKIITQYEAYPATQKSLILYSPDFLAMLLVVLAVVGAYAVFQRVFADPRDETGQREVRHAFHAACLTVIIFLAFLKNSYLAILLLLLPAYSWMAIRHQRGRIANLLLLLGGSITLVTLVAVMTTVFHVGVPYWYVFLSATYGLISAYSVILFAMALTVMIRIFRTYMRNAKPRAGKLPEAPEVMTAADAESESRPAQR